MTARVQYYLASFILIIVKIRHLFVFNRRIYIYVSWLYASSFDSAEFK